MKYEEEHLLKDGRKCLVRSGAASDAEALLDVFIKTHAETDYLASYPDENTHTVEEERDFLSRMESSPDEAELLAFLDGQPVGSAGFHRVGRNYKTSHRAEFGISVIKANWGLGIGRALTETCIALAKQAGYCQLELQAVAENATAIALYQSVGFMEYGRNPKGFRSRLSGWQELVLMRLKLR